MKISDTITVVPFIHGRLAIASYIRKICLQNNFDCIAVDIPAIFESSLSDTIDLLPIVYAIVASNIDEPCFYIPLDPCDAAIEAIRQSRQNHVAFRCIGYPVLSAAESLRALPDEYAIEKIGFEQYFSLCLHVAGKPAEGSTADIEAQYCAWMLKQLALRFKNILALVHLRHFASLVYHFKQEKTYNLTFDIKTRYQIEQYPINPDHLYFALGELPFITARFEKQRHDLLATDIDVFDALKELFLQTRDEYFDSPEKLFFLSPSRIRCGLQFLRNLALIEDRFMPSLFDIVTAAKGIGGNSYALQILKSAKYYPYLPIELPVETLSVGIDRIRLPSAAGPRLAVNLFRDKALVWKTLSIKSEPLAEQKKKYRYIWNPFGMCSHVPEDKRIESFNAHIRKKACKILVEDFVKSEKFSASVKDGVDIRETLRKWYSGEIYVKEIPPIRAKVDTVVIIFDDSHDTLYPHLATWYAEHPQESTLTFFATDPFDNLIGPGIAKSYYGGLSLLFPPRYIPDIFQLTEKMNLGNLSTRLMYGALLFSQEKAIAYIAKNKPSLELRLIANKMKKHIVWIPMSSFSAETLRKLRVFHVLNGKIVRSWASRFIGD